MTRGNWMNTSRLINRKEKLRRVFKKIKIEQDRIRAIENEQYLLDSHDLFEAIQDLNNTYYDSDRDVKQIHDIAIRVTRKTESFISGDVRPARSLADCLGTALKPKQNIFLPIEMGLESIHLERGTNMVIGARSGVGKTSAMVNLAFFLLISNPKARIILFSLEMTEDQIFVKLLQIFYKNIKKRDYDFFTLNKSLQNSHIDVMVKEEAVQFTNLFADRLVIINAENMTASDICRNIEAHNKEDNPFLMAMIDYIQIVQPEIQTLSLDRRLQVSTTSQIITRFAKENRLSFAILSQLNGMEEFMESKQILNDSGVAILLSDEAKEGKEKIPLENTLMLSILKSRFSARFHKQINFQKKTGVFHGEA
jgi:replicative DNA helicase